MNHHKDHDEKKEGCCGGGVCLPDEMLQDMDCCDDECCCDCDDMDYGPEVAKVGEFAPYFEGQAYYKGEFTEVSLADYEGKWLWLFLYPLDFTFVCPTEILEMSKRAEEFKKHNCEVLLGSVDSVHSHKAWSKEIGDLAFPMISDIHKDISESYGALHEDGMSLRGAFLIDPEGMLQASIVHNLPVGRNVDELIRVVEAFQSGELCPVGWKKGDKTLGKA